MNAVNDRTYRRISAVVNMDRIMDAVAASPGPVNGDEIVRQTGIPLGTAMCYVATLLDIGYLAQSGDNFVLGMKLARFWARTKHRLEREREEINAKLAEIGGEK